MSPPRLDAATRYDPSLRFSSIQTPHFVIHYHEGEEALALRLAGLVEDVHADLTRRLGHAPRARTHVVLVDQDDDPNGWTTPLPYNLMELVATPPSGASLIGNTDDWLRLVFTHEYAHVLHLDPARGWARAARHLFGRPFFAFPNLTTPAWQIEGIATWAESLHGQGRVPAGDFRNIVAVAAREGRLEPLDRVNGGLVAWPAGTGWYAYGAYFHEYLARRFGERALAELSRRTAGRVPYLTSGAFEKVFGQSLGSLWREFEQAERRETAAAEGPARAEPAATRRSFFGYLTEGPRFEPDGGIVFTRRDARRFPSLTRIEPGGRVRRVATRYGGAQTSVTAEALYFDQTEYVRSVGLVNDLYRLDRATGRVSRLTYGARLSDPDVSPDGRHVAAIRTGSGRRSLVVFDREALEKGRTGPMPVVTFGGPDEVLAGPRWSPDGASIVVEARRQHGPSTIAVVRPHDRARRTLVSSEGRSVTPDWTPDGRAIVFASARDGRPFDLYCVSADERATAAAEPLTTVAGGARSPAVSADGRMVAFIGYTSDGQDVFTMPFACPVATGEDREPPRDERSASAPRPVLSSAATVGAQPPASRDSIMPPVGGSYRPWSTLGPRSWIPVMETSDNEARIGAATGGVDALGYHAWAATATWSVTRASEFAPVSPGARPDFTIYYAYDRWRPTLFGQYTDETTPLLVAPPGERGRPVAIRERSVDLGATLPFRRVRSSHALFASFRLEHDTLRGPLDEAEVDRGSLRGGWVFQSTKRYGYSISPQDGVAVGAGIERAMRALGGDGDATFVRGDVRAYLPLGPRNAVVALRATAVRSSGDRAVQRVPRLGGSDAEAAVLSFDEDASSLLRAFANGQFTGTRLALVNAEYRWPIAWIERGHGTSPGFLRSISVTAFADAGHTWDRSFRFADWKQSWGAEVTADVVVGYVLPLTVTAGAAWGRDGAGTVPSTRTAYVRIGHGF